MEIHKPKAIHSLREFLSELGTIVLGIVIALALEAAVQAQHDAHMVAHARADFREELTRNRAAVQQDLQRNAAMEPVLAQLIGLAEARLHHAPPAPPPNSVTRTFVNLRQSAWRTALSTQVMAHFPHDEARALSEAYAEQEAFAATEQTAQQDWFELAAFDAADPAISDSDVRQALKQVRVSYAYLVSLENLERRLVQAYDGALAKLG
jgi:hypothetical protein